MINSFEEFINTSVECRDISQINISEWQCKYSQQVEDCDKSDGFINYIEFTYCTIESPVKAVIIFGFWITLLFIALGTTVDDFLCPAMITISKALRLSHNVAGVTLLAFGNGSTDIFTSISSIRGASADLMIGELLGAGIFITTIVAGFILILSDFKLMERPLIRDIGFYLVGSFIVWVMFYKGSFELHHSIALIAVYLAYFLVVVGSGICFAKFYKNKNSEEQNSDNREHEVVFEQTYFRQASCSKRTSSIPDDEGVVLRRFGSRDMKSRPRNRTLSLTRYPYHHHFENAIFSVATHEHKIGEEIEATRRKHTISDDSFTEKITTKTEFNSGWNKWSTDTRKNWKEFFIHINPIDVDSFKKDRWYLKIYYILRAPIYFVLTITIPVVDEENVKHNWCKILNIMHLIISPQFFLFITKMSNDGDLKHELIILAISLVLAFIVFFTSNYEKPPIYHIVFAIIGAVIAIAWVYALTSEIVEVLETIGLIFNLSDIILGLTVLSWGNSLGDLITDVNMARHGYPRMGISACFGGPFFNLLLGIGIPYTVLLTTEESVDLKYSNMISLMYATISVSLGSTLVILILSRFKSTKIHGIFLIALYVGFTTIAILLELSII